MSAQQDIIIQAKVVNNHPQTDFSVYFLVGKDPRLLNQDQQKEILNFMAEQKYNSSIFVYNSHETIRKYRIWKQKLPWIKVHYAIKSNPTIPLLNDLIKEGSNFDCASKNQMQLLLSMGVKPEQIIYSNPVKQEADLQWANDNGIKLTTADTIQQLQKIQQYAPKIGVLWRIAVKQQTTDNLSTHFSGKFGDDFIDNQQIAQRMKKIKNMGISLKGIHFHCGSGHHGSSAFGKGISLARQCIRIGKQQGHQMGILDIGGGYPVGQLHQKLIDVLKTTRNDPLGYVVFAQPGRHLCGNSFYLLTKVLGKRVKNGQTCYHLNQSVYHTFNCNLMDGVSFQNNTNQFYSYINSSSRSASQIKETATATLFGMTCDGVDIITQNISVPVNLKISDWLCISGMGAYSYGSKSSFNGMIATNFIQRWEANLQNNKRLQIKLAQQDEECPEIVPALYKEDKANNLDEEKSNSKNYVQKDS